MSLTTRKQLDKDYNEVLIMWSPDEVCFHFHFQARHLGVLTDYEMSSEIRRWRVNSKVRFVARDYNNKEVKTEDGRTWFLMVVQQHDKTGGFIEDDNHNPFDPLAGMIFGIWVNGWTYAFARKEHRDKYFEMLNAPLNRIELSAMKTGGIDTQSFCCICKDILIGYGNNPIPVMERGRCCDYCNSRFVIPARIDLVNTFIPKKSKSKSQVKVKNEKGKEVEFEISEEARKKLEDELLKDFTTEDNTKTKTKTKKELQAEETRRANKEKAKAKKEREDFYKRAGFLMR